MSFLEIMDETEVVRKPFLLSWHQVALSKQLESINICFMSIKSFFKYSDLLKLRAWLSF